MRTDSSLPLQTVHINGYDVTYTAYGDGAPLVLVHGSLCDCRYWKPQMTALGKSFRVLAPSLRRYWPERWNGTGGGFSVDQHAQDILAFIDTVCEGAAHVVGHSRGARVALQAALQAPNRVRTLTLADPGLVSAGETDLRGGFRQRALDMIGAGDTDGGLALFIDTVTGPDTWRRMVPWFKEMVRDNAATLQGQTTEPVIPLGPESLRTLAQPTLLIGGALSPPPYPATLERLAGWLPKARKITIAGSSHGMNLGSPHAFNQAILDFLVPTAVR